ncbi:hypothetical protein AB6A40_001249 [Gnathostoma spinigerum]|uniref:Rho-GAP domain-containing protein n=1 Tax=Gnathostoma spinigerum TaxID=75299 RepID=A0ABD6E3S2_9BILA
MRPKLQEQSGKTRVILDATLASVPELHHSKQRSFATHIATSSWNRVPLSHPNFVMQPALQYFLATICDLEVKPKQKIRFGIRYTNTPEVQKLLLKIHRRKCANLGLTNIYPNAIVSVLKEILQMLPRGIFNDTSEEFICVSLSSSLSTALVYVNGLIETLPLTLRQFTYLICRSLKNLIEQSAGSPVESYTDALLLFTPLLFPSSVREIDRFLRATRISLILIDLCDVVFRPFLSVSSLQNNTDDQFFKDVFASLCRLQNWFEWNDETVDETETPEETCASPNLNTLLNRNDYYQLAYLVE